MADTTASLPVDGVAPDPAPPPPARRRSWLRTLLGALVLAALAALAAAGHWLMRTESGAQWLLARVPMLQVSDFRGALLDARWQARQIVVTWSDGQASLTLDEVTADGLQWTWRPHAHAWLGLDLQRLVVRQAVLHSGPSSGDAPQMPAGIALPLQLRLETAELQALRIDELAPLTGLALRGLRLDARPGGEHLVEQLAAVWQGVRVQAAARIGNLEPLPLDLQATLRPDAGGDAPAWAAVLRAGGDLNSLQLSGTLRAPALPGRDAPALDLRAELRPLQRWPLGALHLQTSALDLAALHAQAPQTRLTGGAEVQSQGASEPLQVRIALDNTLSGRWNERRLPVRRLSADLAAQLDRLDRLELGRFEVEFADDRQSAGRFSGSARWQGHELSLDSTLHNLAPQRLDARIPAMQLGGPVRLRLLGLPAPDGASPPPAPQVDWSLDLQGTMAGAPQAVRLALEGSADDRRLELRNLRASAGQASAALHAVLQRVARGQWQLESRGSLNDFDPVPWWPGAADTALRRGPHRLSAAWELALLLPANADKLPPVALAQRLVGNGTLHLHDSLLAGVPLSGELTLGYSQSARPAVATLRGVLDFGGNRLRVDGRGDPAGEGETDELQVDLRADALAALAPIFELVPGAATWAPRQGSVQSNFTVAGRWPALRSQGRLQVSQLQAGTAALAQGIADWRFGDAAARSLALQLAVDGAAWGAQRLEHLRAEVGGTLAEHRITLAGALPLAPGPAAARLLGVPDRPGSAATLRALGAWKADDTGGGRWRVNLERLNLGAWDGQAGNVAPVAAWAVGSELRAEISFDASGRPVALQADAGRLRLAEALSLRWDEIQADLREDPARLRVRAEIDPFPLVPLLQRMQPDAGWQGDLRLAARVDLRAGERVDADIVFERHDGDLHLAGIEGVQLLGLTEMRLALSAHDGLWQFTPVFRGRSMGEITGSARVRTTAGQRWPDAQSTLEGSVQARVADLGIWGAWVPPGWRLAGELRTTATLGGRLGDPRYTGELSGSSLSVRNLLLGINVGDGQLKVRLDGDTATVEQFRVRGGDGALVVTGGASLGATPRAQLQFKAERFRVLGRVDRLVIASGQADLDLSPSQGRLEGSLVLDEGLYDTTRGDAPSLDDDVTVRRPGDELPAPDEVAAPRAKRNFALRMDIDLGPRLRVRGRGLDTLLRGKLRLTNPGGVLAVNGVIRTEEGTYAAYGQKLDIERGVIDFSGPADNPRLDVLALRPNIDNRVGVLIQGNLQNLRVRLYSEPELTDTEKLSWLVLGRAPDGLGRSDTALLQRAAVALLAGDGEAPTDSLMKALGIDDISLRQSDGEVRETVVTLGKQLGRRWYLGYERGVNSTTGTWQLIYRIAQRFTLRAQSGLESSLDVIWVWRTQETPADAGMRKSLHVPP